MKKLFCFWCVTLLFQMTTSAQIIQHGDLLDPIRESLESPTANGTDGTDSDGLCLENCLVESGDEPWKLFQSRPNLEIGGWSQTGYHTLDNGMFNNTPDVIQQHQTWLYAEKIADGSSGLDFGFRMDYLFGTDAPDTQAFGNSPGVWDIDWSSGGSYGHAIPQLYGEIANENLSIKIGHFFTTVGYEVVPAPDNFFYSHAFTMYNSEPFTHTGVLAALEGEQTTTYLGWSAGWDTGFDRFGGSNVIAGASVQITEDSALTYMATGGRIGNGNDRSGYSHSIVLDKSLTEKLNYVFQTDLVDFNSNTFGDRRSIGVNQYLLYDLTDRLGVGSRIEWWQTELSPADNADLLALTFGVRFEPNHNTVLRSEIRWNRDNDGFIVPIQDNQKTGFGCDLIVKF